jgi:hypothetical protein
MLPPGRLLPVLTQLFEQKPFPGWKDVMPFIVSHYYQFSRQMDQILPVERQLRMDYEEMKVIVRTGLATDDEKATKKRLGVELKQAQTALSRLNGVREYLMESSWARALWVLRAF